MNKLNIAIGSIVYSCTFFKEINCKRSFHVSECCLYDLLYWPQCSEFFLNCRVSIFSLHGLSFWLRLVMSNLYLCFSILMMHSSVDLTWFVFLSLQNLMTDICSSLMLIFWFAASKQILLWDLNNFCYKPIPNIAELTFMEKNSGN